MVTRWPTLLQTGILCESQVTVCNETAYPLDEGARIEVIIIELLKPFDLVPYDRLNMKIGATAVVWKVFVWVRESGFGGLVVTMQASGTQDRGFEHG
jgi:hypothetical protein